MIIGGSYNFGTWNPPTGLEAVRYSEQINFELACKYNNLRVGKEEGLKQSYGINLVKFKNPDMELINYLNDGNRKIFTGMIRQGWGGY
ncbi:hypothetical protein QUB29_26485 [Microcoleus sp. B4b_D2]|uniref:hypothetical protein n=1 Tax=Microcoleus sp. B4b_D2 TaxID=3055310 RepID=UPI002FCEB86B